MQEISGAMPDIFEIQKGGWEYEKIVHETEGLLVERAFYG